MIREIKTNGLIKVGDYEFTSIEGGFGKDKKSMLVKDIANIHNKKIYHINELINNNRNRFKDNIDIIDLLGIGLNDTELKDFGFSQQMINSYRGRNGSIYVLSERGYSKLLKLLDDDLAWEIYDMFVDRYFKMRETIKEISKKDLLILNIIKSNNDLEKAEAIQKYELGYVKPLEIKEEYHDKVLDSDGTLTVREIAQDFGKTANWLNKILNGLGVQFKQGKKWHLYSKYKDMGLVKEITVLDEENDKNYTRMKWTQKGREFIHKLLKENYIIE
jgi:hypothetical protein